MVNTLPPNPASFASVQAWAANFYEYLVAQARLSQQNDPLPVLLPHKIGDERAAVDGIVMYDPIDKVAILSIDGQWSPIAMNDIKYAELRVYNSYGDTVSVAQKAKALNKWGYKTAIGTTLTTVQAFQGSELNETYVTTNLIDSISSSVAGDTSKTYVYEGQTIDGSGNLTFVSDEVTTNASDGRTKVTLPTPVARLTRAYLKDSGTFGSPQTAHTGTIYFYDDTGGVTNGVPNTASATKLILRAGETQSEKASTSISQNDYYFISYLSVSIGNSGANEDRVTVGLEHRDVANGGPWRSIGRDVIIRTTQNGRLITYSPYLIIPKNHDVRVRAICNANTAEVHAEFGGYLAAIQ